MSKMFQIAKHLRKFFVPFIAFEESKGYWKGNGDYIEGGENVPVEMEGAFLPIGEDDLRYSDVGTFSVKDKKVITESPLKFKQLIEFKGDRYTIQKSKDYETYADVYVYFAVHKGKGDTSD